MNNLVAGAAVAAVAMHRLTRSTAFEPKRWTDRKRELVQESWRALQRADDAKAEHVGIELFRRFFQRHPGFLQLFGFRDQPLSTLFLSAPVRLHAGLVVATLTHLIDQLDDVEKLKTTCAKLGQRHKKYKAKRGHFNAFGVVLVQTLALKLGEDRFDSETKQAWQEMWLLISTTMMKGTPRGEEC